MHKIKYIIFIFFSLNLCSLFAQNLCNGIDTVYSFTAGKGQNAGQSDEYYPENIFGFPSGKASYQIPEQNPEELLSLGFEGEIIVGFRDYKIVDHEGPDFIIFENAFENPVTGNLFVEPAKIAVSNDGINFREFQYDPETLVGCAGISPTIGNGNPCDPSSIGGDAFDLADIKIDSVTHIKITDISYMLKENPSHQYYDPIITGFDLDAVVGLHLIDRTLEVKEEKNAVIIYETGANRYFIRLKSFPSARYFVFNLIGTIISKGAFREHFALDISGQPAGIYFLNIITPDEIITKKIVVY